MDIGLHVDLGTSGVDADGNVSGWKGMEFIEAATSEQVASAPGLLGTMSPLGRLIIGVYVCRTYTQFHEDGTHTWGDWRCIAGA